MSDKAAKRIGKEEFDKFLVKHRIKTKFYKNHKTYWPKSLLIGFFRENPPGLYLACAFHWEKSPEKEPYWSKLNVLWQEKINENKERKR